MNRLIFVLAFSLFSVTVQAQVPIIIGPGSTLVWDMPGMTANAANACTYAVLAGPGPSTPVVGQVTCVEPVAPATAPSCSVNLIAQTSITVGSGAVAMTATCGGQTSLPSVPFQYLDLVVPIPTNVRFK